MKKSSCEVDVPTSEIFRQCPVLSNNTNIYLSYMCFDPYIELGSLQIDRSSLSYLLASLDAVSVLIILITIIILRCDYSKLNKSFKKSHKLINQFTINIKNLEVDFDRVDEEVNSLLNHFDKIIRQSLKIEYLKGKVFYLNDFNIQKEPYGVELITIKIGGRSKAIKSVAEQNTPINNNGYNNLNELNNNINSNDLKNDLNNFGADMNNFDADAHDNNFNSNNNDNLPIKKEKIYDFSSEVNFPTYVYEVNYPYLSDNKLCLVLKREKLFNELSIKNSRLKKLRKERNFGVYSIPQKSKNKNEENSNADNNLDNFNELNLDNLDNLDNLLDLDNNNNNKNENGSEVNNENNNNNPEDANLKVEFKPENLPEPSTMEKYEHRTLMENLQSFS